jgi:hypothetical protein
VTPERTKAWIALAIVCLAAVAMSGLFASASSSNDPNDTTGPLDVKRVDKIGNERPRWTTVTYRDWRVARMFDRGYFVVYLDTFGTRRFDYYALVRSKGTQMSGTLWRDRRDRNDVRIGFVESWKRNARSLAVRVPLRRVNLPKRRPFYFWQARTLYTGPGCTKVCIDVVPNQGSVQEFNPLFVEPSPSPTTTLPPVTPTPTPTST